MTLLLVLLRAVQRDTLLLRGPQPDLPPPLHLPFLQVAGEVDVLYQTRIQKERFEDLRDYEKAKGEGAGLGLHAG